MLKPVLLSTLAAAVFLAACGGAQSDASPASVATASPSSSAAVSASPVASSVVSSAPGSSSPVSPSAASAAPASTNPSAASSSSSAASSPSGKGLKLTIAPNTGQVDIKVKELLADNKAQTDAVESTQAVSGAILLDAAGAVQPGSKISVDLTTLKSDRSQRDNFVKRSVLETSQFPNVEFVPLEIQGLNGLPPSSGDATFKLVGNATVRGVTKPMTWTVTAQFDQQGAKGTATSPFQLTAFGITPPRIGPVLQVDDGGTISFSFVCTRSVI